MTMAIGDLVERFRTGDRLALARALSVIENQRAGFAELLHSCYAHVGRAHRIGLTGPPGAGKSTLATVLTKCFREQGLTVGIVAVDPTSPFTGGAILGDRVRMQEVALDEGVFIRSMATRGSLGGLALTTVELADAMDAFGFDIVLLETVGVGQSELEVAHAVDTTVVILVPESGDGIQVLKSGLMEIADIFVVNKSDRDGAQTLQKELEALVHLSPAAEWNVPVLPTVGVRGEGVPELAQAVQEHGAILTASGTRDTHRRDRAAHRVRQVVNTRIGRKVWDDAGVQDILARGLTRLYEDHVSPYSVAEDILAHLSIATD